jgi:hypothetical protein
MDTTAFVNDIPLDTARLAHSGTSFVPEERAEQERTSYAATLTGDLTKLRALATTPEKEAALVDEFARYRASYARHYCAYLNSRSRCLSTMITGGSNFNVRRNEKRNSVADRRLTELNDFRERALKAIRRVLCPELAPIMTGDDNAAERLTAKIAAAEALQERMKAVNKAHDRYAKDPATLEASGLSDQDKASVRNYRPAYSWEPHPFAPFGLTNNNANIRRMKERLALVGRLKATPETTAEGTAARIEDVPAENRVRLFFPGKPEAAVRDMLKHGGFRWTPSLGCWQAYRNTGSLALAQRVAGVPS